MECQHIVDGVVKAVLAVLSRQCWWSHQGSVGGFSDRTKFSDHDLLWSAHTVRSDTWCARTAKSNAKNVSRMSKLAMSLFFEKAVGPARLKG